MGKLLVALIMTFLFGFCAPALAIDRNSDIAVMDFGTRPGATEAEININRAEFTTSECVINRLLQDKCFQVKDKELVMSRLRQENLSTVGLVDPDTAKKIGKMLNVRYILYGNLTSVSIDRTGGGMLLANNTTNSVQAHIVGRVMDVQTGNILYMVKGSGKSSSSRSNAVFIHFGTVKVPQDSVYNAIQKAAYDMVDALNKKISK